MLGRPNTPSALKRLQGTDRADRTLANEMAPPPLKTLPQAPDQIKHDESAKQVWQETTVHLEALQLLTVVDLHMLALYCREVSRYWKAQARLDEEGEVITSHNGYPMPNPWVGIANQSLDRALKIASQYGFTPAARTRIHSPGKKETDPFEDFLNN